MNRSLRLGLSAFVCGLCVCLPAKVSAETRVAAPPAHVSSTSQAKNKKPAFPDWSKVIEGTKKLEGLFNLYYSEKDQKLYLELSKGQYNQNLLLAIAISRGAGTRYLGGDTLNFGNQWVLSFRRSAKRVLVIRKNVLFRARPGTPQADAVRVSYSDSVIAALPIRSEQSGGAKVLIDLADLFMVNLGAGDLAGLGVSPDRNRSTWAKVKAFPKNVEVKVATVFTQKTRSMRHLLSSSTDVPDPRGTQIVIHYGLSKLPSAGYKPRLADDRVGHFLSVVKDYSSDINDTAFVRYATRWNLVKSDPAAEKSVPREPIIFWIEKTVPRQYRPHVRAGILEWNKAFEKIGFIDAIQVRDQQSVDDFDPEDIRFNTFRWIATSAGFAMGPSRTNPLTGQILDADIVFDESMVRTWREDYLRREGIPQGLELLRRGERQAWLKMYAAELPWMTSIEPDLNLWLRATPASPTTNRQVLDDAVFSSFDHRRCQLGPGMVRQLGLLSAVLHAQGKTVPGGKVPEAYIGQAIKQIVMHEVGHTLGLRHNFKASGMLGLKDVNNQQITHQKGMSGSIMDYLPANFAPKGEKQGDYFTTTIGPYDYWAIEYAYKPFKANEAEELAKIAHRASQPGLEFATDHDLRDNPDPRIDLWDLGDPLDYARQRVQLLKDYVKTIDLRVVAEGEGWQRARSTFNIFLGELAQATAIASFYVGAEYTNRYHRGDSKDRSPLEPIPVKKQRECIQFLEKNILSDQAFQFPPALLRKLAPRHWDHWGTTRQRAFQYPLLRQVLAIQRTVLSRFLDPDVLRSIQNIELLSDKDQETLQMPEVFDALTNTIWSELAPGRPLPKKVTISTIRRNLQQEHSLRLSRIVLGPGKNRGFFDLFFGTSYPADARSLARLHLAKIVNDIDRGLKAKSVSMDTYTRAHLEEARTRIQKVLDASVLAKEP